MGVLTGSDWDNSVTIEGYQPKRGEDIDPHFNTVTPGYFDAMGMHLLSGRDFRPQDDFGSPRVVLVNASFANRYFKDGAAVGHRIGFGSDPGTPTDIEIVGVVNDTRYESLRDEIPLQVYTCATQSTPNSMVGYLRTLHDPESAFSAIRGVVHELDANLPLLGMKTLERQMDESLITDRMIATLSGVFGALATALAILGLYGVMTYTVTRRSREIGIRMALGAGSNSVLWLVMKEVLMLVTIGIVAGSPAAYGLTRLIRAQLYGIATSADLLSISLASVLLAAVALLAGYIPARRAAAYDPVRVLRYE
jgi:predicted permease